jgi:putative transcriptional regulator
MAIRKRLNMSQSVFAAIMNVSKVTAISWEKGRRKPTGPALRLLDFVLKKPDVFRPLIEGD